MKFYFIIICLFILSSCLFNEPVNGLDIRIFNNTPVEELAQAVKKEDLATIKDLITIQNLPIDYQYSKYGNTVLMYAVIHSKKKSIRVLLELGADPNLRGKQDESAFLMSCGEYGQCDIAVTRLMLNYGADINSIETNHKGGLVDKTVRSALETACMNSCFDVFKLSIDEGAKFDKKDERWAYRSKNKMDILHYLVIEKEIVIPEYIFIRREGNPDEEKITLTNYLLEQNYRSGSEDYKLREEILEYLKIKEGKM